MELANADWDDKENRRTQQAARRLEVYEAQRRLEHFAHPEDLFDEVHPDDANHDLEINLYRRLARSAGWILGPDPLVEPNDADHCEEEQSLDGYVADLEYASA